MRDAVLLTGGMVVQADTYHNPIFRESLKRMFLKDGEEGFIGITSNATLEVCVVCAGGVIVCVLYSNIEKIPA